ncbi:pentapeptide repeat-containing protein [Actinophytocola xanthii]|uniref:Oxidoreductase n=1 Tax=Actinophytocola xanthii TaxID=1912961 RepID=A0A1Q8CVW4_9PSEU|nr:pentapeptide repeat-containing protein [Actinophytocola xanthii]OLF18494.1 hypothetical protein BU204_05940 [Actinophytocola xanthii]
MRYLTVDDLTDVERRLVDAVASGEPLDLVGPDEATDPAARTGWGPERTVRGELVRQLLLDRFGWTAGDRPDPRGVRLRGARLAGGLDLAEVESRLPLSLVDCVAEDTVRLTGSRLSAVDLSGLVGTNVVAREATIERAMRLAGARLECRSPEGTLDLGGTRLGTWLDLAGSHLVNTDPEGAVFNGNDLSTGAGIFLSQGFRAEGGGPLGTVRLSGATIGGQAVLTGASLRNAAGPALVADYLRTRSNLMLGGEFHAEGRYESGTLRLLGADIGGRLVGDNGRVDAIDPDHLAVNLAQTHVAGDLFLPADFTDGLLLLTGLTYDGMARRASLGQWLDMLANRTPHYASQPYFQLASAHQAAGHERDVRRIHLARQRDLLRRGDLDFWGRLWHRITGLTVGYGYRPVTALVWWTGTVALSVLLITAVAGPSGAVQRSAVGDGRPSACSAAEQVGLALTMATPLVKPGSQQPCLIDTTSHVGQVVIAGTWVLQALGWAFVTLFVAGFTGLVRRSP